MTMDNAASGSLGSDAGLPDRSLDNAISAALGGSDEASDASPKGTLPGDDIADELTNPAVAKLAEGAKRAGDKRDGEDAAEATDDATGTKEAAADPAKDGEAKALEAPKHWPDADRQAFAKLPKDGQEIALKLAKNLEGGFTRKSQELSDEVKFAKAVRGQFSEKDRAQMREAGVDEAGAIRYLMQTQRFAAEDPPGYARWVMQTLRLNPADVFPQTKATDTAPKGSGAPDPQAAQPSTGDPKLDDLLADPAVKQLKADLADRDRRLAAIEGHLTARQRAELDHAQRQEQAERQREYNAEQALLGRIGEFRSTLDEQGQLAYPHFDAVKEQMGAIMQTDRRINAMPDGPEKMAAAYHKVVAGDPELSKPIIEAEVAKRMAAAQKAAEAQRAKRVTAVKPAVGAPAQRAKTGTLDDAILGAFSKSGF